MTHAILTAIGADRPGLVDEVSQFIFQRGGSIEDSRMVNLRGQFALMALVAAQETNLAGMERDLGQLQESARLHAELHPAEPSRAAISTESLPYRLTATTLDQPGLVHHIAHLLRSLNLNIESLDTHLAAAPITGAPVFEMELTLSIPRQTPLTKVRQELGRLCDELNIDWQLTAMSQ